MKFKIDKNGQIKITRLKSYSETLNNVFDLVEYVSGISLHIFNCRLITFVSDLSQYCTKNRNLIDNFNVALLNEDFVPVMVWENVPNIAFTAPLREKRPSKSTHGLFRFLVVADSKAIAIIPTEANAAMVACALLGSPSFKWYKYK